MGGVAWTEEEDYLLKNCIKRYGEGKWYRIPVLAGLNRCRKSCRLRWLNYLRPNIKRGNFADEEVNLIIKLHKLLGNRWSLIAGRLPGRTANDVKNYWNCHLSKRLNNAQQTEDQTAINMEIIRPHPPVIATTGGSMKSTSPDNISPNNQPKTEEKTCMSTPFYDVEVDQRCQDHVKEEDSRLGVAEPGRFVSDLAATDHQFAQFDEGGSSKWDWDDLIFDMDLWTGSL